MVKAGVVPEIEVILGIVGRQCRCVCSEGDSRWHTRAKCNRQGSGASSPKPRPPAVPRQKYVGI